MDDFGNDLNEVAPYSAFAPYARFIISGMEFVDMEPDELAYWMEA